LITGFTIEIHGGNVAHRRPGYWPDSDMSIAARRSTTARVTAFTPQMGVPPAP
jgi:hypothetical protein